MAERLHAFTDDALADHDAVALAEHVATGTVSPSELADAALARAAAVDELNAVVLLDEERARSRSSEALGGVLAGVPTFVKGLTAVAGLPNRMGSRAVPNTPAEQSSPTVVQLESTGLVNLGLSTTPEFGLTATTEPAVSGITRNPWDLDRSPGGSSGGSAALVAAGVVPIAHANDGGGSIRIPASCCGLVGLKPSRGRIQKDPLPPVIPVDIAIDGVVTRSVRDTAAFLHGAELHAAAPDLPPIGHVTAPIDRPLRIGVITQRVDHVDLDSVNLTALAETAGRLEALGHHVELVENPFPARFIGDFMVLWSLVPFALWYTGKREFGDDWDRDQLEPWTKYLVRHFRRNAASAPTAFRRLRRIAAEYSTFFAQHDVLVSTTLGGPVHRVGYLDTSLPPQVQLARVIAQVPTTPFQNVGGGPAISLPLATDDDGLPLGIHFAADMGQEALLLELALQLEQAHPWGTLANG